jgi:CHAT domain-containing protein
VYTDACDGVLKQSKETMWDADAAAAAGHLDEALGRYESVAAVSAALRAAALTRAGALYEKRGDSAKAIGTYAKAIDAAEALQSNLRLDELVMSWAAQQKPLYTAMIGLSFDHGHADSAFAYAERARARAFLNQLGNRRLPPAAVPKELASELYDVRRKLFDLETYRAHPQEQTALPNPFAPGDDGRRHEEEAARKRFQELLARVAQANPAYVSLVQVDTVPLKQLQREVLPADATLLEYFVLRDRVLVWVIDHQSVHSAALPIASADLRSLIMELRELITDRDAGAQAIGGRLYDALIAPVAQHIRQPNLIIVPHGVLHYMPFPALWSASRNQYLVESYTITLASSASALRYAPKQRAGKGVLIFGNPDRSLPNAETEANGIGSIYGTPAWIGKDARESRLRQDGARAGIVHIAAHARYESGRPLFTRIDLAPNDGAAAQSEGGDGRLHLYEVYDLDLSATRLAVLSACETAMGPASEGDDLVALSRAFRYAGAASVVTTLWAIDDASTSALMNDFYHRLHDGVPAAEALRQSQLYLLRETRFREPYHWAAFTLTR